MTVTEYQRKVRALGCLICQQPAQLHHVREGQGMGQKASEWLVVPLCHFHHAAPHGFHGRTFVSRYLLDEMDLLASVLAKIMELQDGG
jgi:hypothetical protein